LIGQDLERELGEKGEEIRKLRSEGGGRQDPEEIKIIQVNLVVESLMLAYYWSVW